MFKHLMSGASLLALAVRDANNDQGADDRAKLRDQLAKGVNVTAKSDSEPAPKADAKEEKEEAEVAEEDEEADEEVDPEAEAEADPAVEETAEQKTAREAKEAEEAKSKRKDDRIQKRIDKAVAAQKQAEAEMLQWKAKAEANPDTKLTEEEVQTRAEAIAAEKVAAKEMERAQKDFEKACDKIADDATKIDKEFNTKVNAMAAELGAIPHRVITVLSDLDNGAAVLASLVNDIDEAEKIYDLQAKPERLAIALVRISDKLAEAAKPKPKPLSKVPDAVKPVNGTRVQSTAITADDTKPENMDNYIRKRTAQREADRKARGY